MSEAQGNKQWDSQSDSFGKIIGLFRPYDDAQLQEFITAKGNEMAANLALGQSLLYEFKYVDFSAVILAVPEDMVYFNNGYMAHFNNEAEFAGVLVP